MRDFNEFYILMFFMNMCRRKIGIIYLIWVDCEKFFSFLKKINVIFYGVCFIWENDDKEIFIF